MSKYLKNCDKKIFLFSVSLEYQDNCQPLDMWRWWMFGWSSLSPTPSSSLLATASRKLVAIREKLWWTVKVVSNIYLNSFNFETQQPPTRDLSSDCVWCQLQTHLKTILCSISYKSFTVNCLQSTTKNNPALKAKLFNLLPVSLQQSETIFNERIHEVWTRFNQVK